MLQSTRAVIGVVLFAILLAIFAFTRQQQSALNEATAVANVHAAGTSQAEADSARATAIAQANMQATAQAEAEFALSTAVAEVASAMVAQMKAEAAQASAVAQSASQGTAQAEAEGAQTRAEATGMAAIETAQAGATAAREEAAIAQTAISLSTQSMATSSFQQQSAQATMTTVREQINAVKQTATAQNIPLNATQTAVSVVVATYQSALTPVAPINQPPEDTMRFLVENGVIAGYGGRVAASMEISLSLNGEDNLTRWQPFAGEYSDFVVSADIYRTSDANEDKCGLFLRQQDTKNLYAIQFDYYSNLIFDKLQDGEWHLNFPIRTISAIRTGRDDVNHMVVVAKKDELSVYINGQPAGVYIDRTFTGGGAGVIASTFANSDQSGCTFSNAWIWRLDDSAPTFTPPAPTAVAVAMTATEVIAEANSVPELTQDFVSADQSLSLKYPRDWLLPLDLNGFIVLGNFDYSVSFSGTAGLMRIGFFALYNTGEVSLMDYASMMADDLSGSTGDTPITFAAPEFFQMNTQQGVRVLGTSEFFDAEIIIYGTGDGIILMSAFCALGEMPECEPILLAIAETVKYQLSEFVPRRLMS